MGQAYRYFDGNDSDASTEDILCKVAMAVDLGIEYYSMVVHGLIAVNRFCVVCKTTQRAMTTRTTITSLICIVCISIVIGCAAGTASSANPSSDTVNCIISDFHGLKTFLFSFWVTLIGTLLLIVILNLKMILHVRSEQLHQVGPDIELRAKDGNTSNENL